MSPLARLPIQCFPHHDPDVQPPLFLKGWIIDVPQMRKRAAEKGIEAFIWSRKSVPGREMDQDPSDNSHPGEIKVFEPTRTFEPYTRKVLEELGIELLRDNFLELVWGPNPSAPEKLTWYHAFIIYDNYNLDARPGREEINKMREALGFSDEPYWFANAFYMRWTYL